MDTKCAHVFGVLAFRAAKESFIVLDLQILEGTTQQGSARVEGAAARRRFAIGQEYRMGETSSGGVASRV